MLEDTFERHVVGDKYGDIPLGLYIIRGDSVVLLGEVDEAKQSEEQLWRLVNLFCIAHHLPLETTYLIQLARSNDYVRLLFAAQAQSIPVETGTRATLLSPRH